MSQIDLGNAMEPIGRTTPFALSGGAAETEAPDVPLPLVRRFSIEEYHRMSEAGILGAEERLELLEGIIFVMSPRGLPHGQGVVKSTKALERVLPSGWQAVSQQSIASVGSEPVADVFVLRGDYLTYSSLPTGADVGLIVEVADSSLIRDRTIKRRLYAAAGIPEYWIINLVDRRLEVYRRPTAASAEAAARYDSVEEFGPDRSVDVVLDGATLGTIAVGDLLP